jgi:mono/diheme cytochrome c family protein
MLSLLYYCTSRTAMEVFSLQLGICNRKSFYSFLFSAVLILVLAGCDIERRKSDAELGLDPQQAAGRKIYDNYCDRCHAPYSSHGRQGPSMKHIFRKQFLPMSGMPANDDRVTDIIKMGRNKMPAYGQVLNQQQIDDLLAYLHTL